MNSAPGAGRHTGPIWWISALLLVAVGWLVTPHAVTVYDGVGQPDEPYRYVSAPPGGPVTAKPTGGQAALSVVDGVSADDVSIVSAESGPQASVSVPRGELAAPAGTIFVKLTPEAPSDQPVDGQINGNVYRLSITDAAGPVTFAAQASDATIYLRATTAAQPGPVMEHRSGPGQTWRPVTTSRAGNDIYAAGLPGAGEYALVFRRATKPAAAGSGPGSGHQGLIVALLVSLVIMLSVVLAVRWRAREVAR